MVSILATGTRVQTRPKPLDFSGVRKFLSMLSFGGEVKENAFVPALRHVKEPSSFVNYGFASKIHW